MDLMSVRLETVTEVMHCAWRWAMNKDHVWKVGNDEKNLGTTALDEIKPLFLLAT